MIIIKNDKGSLKHLAILIKVEDSIGLNKIPILFNSLSRVSVGYYFEDEPSGNIEEGHSVYAHSNGFIIKTLLHQIKEMLGFYKATLSPDDCEKK